MREVAVYKGEEIIASGTIAECAAALNVKPGTIYFYLTPSYERRRQHRRCPESARTAVRLDLDDDGFQITDNMLEEVMAC